MPRPHVSQSPTADTSAPEQGITTTADGGTVATGAVAMIQFAAGSGHIKAGA